MEAQLNPNKYAQCTGRLFSVKFSKTKNGNSVATVTLSLSNGKDEKTGLWRKGTWVDWKLWGELADRVESMQKGDFISLKGNIGHDEWIDKTTNQPRTKIVFKAVEISLDPTNP